MPQLSSGFVGDTVVNDNTSFNIFLNEATAILAALHWSASFHPTPSQLTVHTDSSNSFDIFNSLCASGPYMSGMGPVPVWLGSVSTGIDPMCRGPASLEGPPSLLSQWPGGPYRDFTGIEL